MLRICILFSFLPPKCPAHVTCTEIDHECGEKQSGHDKKSDSKLKEKRLDFGYWQAAFQRYSLAAVATKQLTMSQCMEHAAIILDVAALAPSQGRSAWLGVLYDEIARYDLSYPVLALKS
jgi:hypothetical protein